MIPATDIAPRQHPRPEYLNQLTEMERCAELWIYVIREKADDLAKWAEWESMPDHNRHAAHRKGVARLQYRKTRLWFESDRPGAFSFTWICHLIGADASAVRRAVFVGGAEMRRIA